MRDGRRVAAAYSRGECHVRGAQEGGVGAPQGSLRHQAVLGCRPSQGDVPGLFLEGGGRKYADRALVEQQVAIAIHCVRLGMM